MDMICDITVTKRHLALCKEAEACKSICVGTKIGDIARIDLLWVSENIPELAADISPIVDLSLYGYGDGYGDGYGYGYDDGDGSGSGSGYGYSNGYGNGNGDGSGSSY